MPSIVLRAPPFGPVGLRRRWRLWGRRNVLVVVSEVAAADSARPARHWALLWRRPVGCQWGRRCRVLWSCSTPRLAVAVASRLPHTALGPGLVEGTAILSGAGKRRAISSDIPIHSDWCAEASGLFPPPSRSTCSAHTQAGQAVAAVASRAPTFTQSVPALSPERPAPPLSIPA